MVGEVLIRAVHHELASAGSLIVIVHGIGGNADSPYCVSAARAAVAAGCAAVRISLRGADGNGDDIYHAGLTEDLRALLSTEQRPSLNGGFDAVSDGCAQQGFWQRDAR